MRNLFLASVCVILFVWAAACPGLAAESGETQGDPVSEITEDLESLLDLDELQTGFQEIAGESGFSVRETVTGLLRGELPFEPRELPGKLSELFFGQLRRQRQMALQILVIVMASALFSNFVRIFDSDQIADISFFMMYLLISTLLMRSFLDMNRSVVQTCGAINRFMQILLPSYLVTIVLSSGSVTAVGFYEITILGMQLLQTLIVRALLPAINFYLVLLLLNQMSGEDCFSRFSEKFRLPEACRGDPGDRKRARLRGRDGGGLCGGDQKCGRHRGDAGPPGPLRGSRYEAACLYSDLPPALRPDPAVQ